ncbi:MAG: hypothetical protein RG741_07135 [Bacteroidales bacterium]|nr:hypothetical protein [Bacteroidales bacterium]
MSSVFFLLVACGPSPDIAERSPVGEEVILRVTEQLIEQHGPEQADRISRGVRQAASLWRISDGSIQEFEAFCLQSYIGDQDELDLVFDRLEHYFEHLYGYMNRIILELKRQIDEDRGPIHRIDQLFGAYSPAVHIQDDLFNNKIAFTIALNFPHYTLEEKNELGAGWTARKWGYARLGDYFTARVPPRLGREYGQASSDVRLYISEYNIFAGMLRNNEGERLFPPDMKLLAHWNIRDEIRSNYGQPGGNEKKEMLYQVMLNIISQDIPMQVINNPDYTWNPYTNELWKDGESVVPEPEMTRRYAHLLSMFRALYNMDPYYPQLDTYIKRRFDASMEIPQAEVEALFREYAASPLIRETAKLISERLGRDLRPYDLWYDGFKARSGISEEELDKITMRRYPNAEALNRDLPRILRQLGHTPQMAEFIAGKIEVDAARGSGHAWRASMRDMPSHLRTRIGANGMDYKGYNIAIHELGHNVEQTISTHFVDNYFINGIPNTAFTEALAFMYQRRDLEFLGIRQQDPMQEHLAVLDVFWDNYEMMGVSLIDMMVWKWMYENPDATPEQLKEAVITIAKDIWNEYYADVFGVKDIPLLAIYSHMIQSPLYLSNYPYGRLIMFQLEDYIRGKNFAKEELRIFSIGQLTPKHWMDAAVGDQISNQPMFEAVERALSAMR